jgi:AraC-like DNA-binding protein
MDLATEAAEGGGSSTGREDAGCVAREQREIWNSRALPSVEVLQIRNTERRCGMFHERFALSVSRSGTGTVRYRGRRAEHDRGSLFLIEPGEAHSSPVAIGPLGWDVVFIDSQLVQSVAEHCGLKGQVHWRSLVVHDDEAVSSFTHTLHELKGVNEPAAAFALDRLLDGLFRRHSERGGDAPRRLRDSVLVRKVQRRLHEQVSENVALTDIAGDLHVSVCHLVRSFSAEMGLPPHQYLLQLRVELARAMLKRGVSSTQAAAELGFSDQSHFNRHFTKVIGVSPGRYAKAVR